MRIEVPAGHDALTEFILFHDTVYEYRSARWPALLPLQLPILTGEGAFAVGRLVRPLAARMRGQIVARVVAVVDSHYQRHWREKLGHLIMFEALPDTRDAVKALMDEACTWLRAQGCDAARAGFGLLEFPFAIDEYETLPPSAARQNPPYYHALLKDAGFESEKGWVDYKIKVSPELEARYRGALEAAQRAGYEIVPLSEIAPARRVAEFCSVWNDAFKAHWGAMPFSNDEVAQMFALFAVSGALETSLLTYQRGEPVAALMVSPAATETVLLKPGRLIAEHEKLNFLGIGVIEAARGRGVSLGMASCAYLKLIGAGARYLSYTLVLDDNWPSRRTAEKLGARVCANYLVYRRDLRR